MWALRGSNPDDLCPSKKPQHRCGFPLSAVRVREIRCRAALIGLPMCQWAGARLFLAREDFFTMNRWNANEASELVPEPTLLLVDDDVALTELVSRYLSENGYSVHCVHDGEAVDAAVAEHRPDLVLLDVMLPGADGLSVCRQLREHFAGPIVMLTALNDEIDEVAALETGADDYLTKPIKPRVLLAHVRAQLRRGSLMNTVSSPDSVTSSGELVIDAGRREVRKSGELIELTSAEFDLLWLLAERLGEVVSRDDIYQRLYRIDFDGVDRSVDLRVSRIRWKLGEDSKGNSFIKTVRNVGYQLAR